MTRIVTLLIALICMMASPVWAQGSLISFASRPAPIATSNTELHAECEIVFHNLVNAFCMDDDGTDVTQLTTYVGGTADHVAVSPQRGHVAMVVLDSAGYSHLLLFDLANDTVTPVVPYFQSAGFGGVDWDLQGNLYFVGREHAPYALDTAVVAEAVANAVAFDIWRIKYDGTNLQRLIYTTTHSEADVSVHENGQVMTWASQRIRTPDADYYEIWAGPTTGRDAVMVFQSQTDIPAHDPELSPDGTQVVFSRPDPGQPQQFGIDVHELYKCALASCASPTQVTPAGNGPRTILPDWVGTRISALMHDEDANPDYLGLVIYNDDGTNETRVSNGPAMPKFIETDAVPALPGATTPDTVPPNLIVNYPSFGIHANAAADVGITTAADYLDDSAGKIAAVTRANNLGTDHHNLTIKWIDICATVASCDFTRLGEIMNNSTVPVILNIAPIWDDGTKVVPADIAAVDWDSAAMSNAYKDLLTVIKAQYPGRVWQIGVGYEADVYFTANPSQVSKYATFLTNIRTHARTTFGTNPFALTMTFRYAALGSLLTTYASLLNQLDFPSLTYYPTATADTGVLAAAIQSELQAVQSTLGGQRSWFLAEFGLTTDSPSSESVQQVALYVAATNLSAIAVQFKTTMKGFTWYQLSDVSSDVRTDFGASSYGKRAGIGIRDTSDVAKDIDPIMASFLGGVTDTPPDPDPDPELPQEPAPLLPVDGATVNNPVLIDWADQANVTFTLSIRPVGGSDTNLDMGAASQHTFTGTAGQSYEWHLTAHNSVGSKPQTVPHRTFTIAPPPLPPPTNLAIISPPDGATDVELNPVLSWSATGATLYRLRFGTTNPPTVEVYSGTAPQFAVTAGSNNTLYRWCIGAINASGTITLCGSFTTEVAAGVATHPILLRTAARDTAWAAMRADYLEDTTCLTQATDNEKIGCNIYKGVITKASQSVKVDATNEGVESALLAQIPGNDAAAWCLSSYNHSVATGLLFYPSATAAYLDVNVNRELFTDWVLVYDWCYTDWTQPQRDTYLTRLNGLASGLTSYYNQQGGWRCGDVDQEIGNYFGIAALYYATKAYNPTIVNLWNDPILGTNLGGTTTGDPPLCVTQADPRSNARDMIASYFGASAPYPARSEGGVWLEATEYQGSAHLGVLGCEAIRTTDAGDDACVEIDAWLDDWARYLTHRLSRDYTDIYQWADVQEPHELWLGYFRFHESVFYLTLSGLLPDGSDRQHMWRQFINFWTTNGTARVFPSVYPSRQMMMANPYITAAADLTALAKCYEAVGQGIYTWNDSWSGVSSNAAQFVVQFKPGQQNIDHGHAYFGNIYLYRKGQYAITNPYSYAGVPGVMPEGVNGVMLEGLDPSPGFLVNVGPQYKQVNGYTCGADYMYVAGTTGGSYRPPSSYIGAGIFPIERYVDEYTRSVVHLQSATDDYNTVFVIDRANVRDPETLARFSFYSSGCYPASATCYGLHNGAYGVAERQRIQNNPRWTSFLYQWVDTNPTVVGNKTSWTLPDGQLVEDDWLTPDSVTITVEDSAQIAALVAGGITKSSELQNRRTKIESAAAQQNWNVMVRAITARDSDAAAPTITELSTTGSCGAALISRTGNDDRIIVWNNAAGDSITQQFPTAAQAAAVLATARYHKAKTCTIPYTQTTANAKMLILDLNPSLSWTSNINGAGAQAITEDSSGFEELAITTAEAKSVVLIGQ